MPDYTDKTPPPPPRGDEEKAVKYVNKLADLLDQNHITVFHTDLARFDPNSMQDHYRVDLGDYQIEVSHSKQPNTGADSFVILFTNLKNVQEQGCEKIILAYIHLNQLQFSKFKQSADAQLERKRRAEEEKRFKAAIAPIDQALEAIVSTKEPEDRENTPQLSEPVTLKDDGEAEPSLTNNPTFTTTF